MLLLVRPGQHANRCSARRLSPTSRHGAQRDSGRRLTSRGGVCAIWLRALWQLQRRVALPGGLRVPTLRRGSPRRHRCRLCRFGCAPCSRRWSSKAVRVRWRGRCGYGETERPARNLRRTVFQKHYSWPYIALLLSRSMAASTAWLLQTRFTIVCARCRREPLTCPTRSHALLVRTDRAAIGPGGASAADSA